AFDVALDARLLVASQLDQRTVEIALRGEVVRRPRLDLVDERVGPRVPAVPVPALVLVDDQHAPEPAGESLLPELVRNPLRLEPEPARLLELTTLPAERGKIADRPGEVECRIRLARGVDRPREHDDAGVVPERRLRRADVDHRARL